MFGGDLMNLMRLCRGFKSADPTKLPNTAEEFQEQMVGGSG